MKKIFALFFAMASCVSVKSFESDKVSINDFLNDWHKAASDANFDRYFGAMSTQSIYIGTDATENWNKEEFMAFAKPYFDRGKAWNFTALQRHIYFSKDGKTAWFDELLNTQMKICRGSGVVVKENNAWKIKHYVLSMTVPNDNTNEVVRIKAPIEDAFISKLNK